MSIDEAVGALIDAIVYASPGTAPDGIDPPYCIYARITTAPDNTLDATPISEHVRFQIDVHAKTYGQARGLCQSIKAAIGASALGGYVLDDRMVFEDAVKLHRCIIDYAVRATPA